MLDEPLELPHREEMAVDIDPLPEGIDLVFDSRGRIIAAEEQQ